MKKIILASKSKARAQLLRQIGLRFTVLETGAEESGSLRHGCARCVIANAKKKARAAAERASGLIIAADTVVFAGRKLIGKPKNLADAVRTLRTLSRTPQWVYTGIAVFDTQTGAMLSDYDKTKVYMYPLSDAQIRNYFKKVSPFDKAGSFDIQGMGAIFIDRIEGCFYNVVGLPLAKLVRMLAKLGIDIFALS